MFEKEAEEYATRECCATCNNINHFCKEKCECWTFARKGAEFGYNKAKEDARWKLKDEELIAAKDLLKRWVDDRPYTVSEQKDLIADTEQFLEEE